MTEGSRVSPEEVRYVAELAHLELSAEEATRLQRDLNAILEHIARLNELDTASVPPMAQASEALAGSDTTQRNVLRADAEQPSLARERVLSAAPETDGVFFKVPKVIER